jgi:hypothetical protein
VKLPLELLLTVSGVPIFTGFEGGYVAFISDLDICNDGNGPAHGDPSYQSETAYYNSGKFLNADKDKYIVIPPQVRKMVYPAVMGCQARMSNLLTAKWSSAVTGDIGPDFETGEAAYCLAKELNKKVTHNSGDDRLVYLYELWPGIPAVVGDKTYKLESAG